MKNITLAVALATTSFSSFASSENDESWLGKNGYIEGNLGAITGMPSSYTGDKLTLGVSGGAMINENFGFDGTVHIWSNQNSYVDEFITSISGNIILGQPAESSGVTIFPYAKLGLSFYDYEGSGCYAGYCASASATDFAPIGTLGIRFVFDQGVFINAQYSRYFTDLTSYDLGSAMIGVGKYF